MNEFQRFIDLGWKLCKIEPGTKGPNYKGWNSRENALTSVEGLEAAGLLHAYSGTCAIDIDDWTKAESFLQEHHIDLTTLFMAPDAVQISSGTPGRAKLLFKLDSPLPTIKLADNKLEFRCATSGGLSVQDVLPPSPHPSGRTYLMLGNPANLPAIPESLLSLWRKNVEPAAESKPTVDKLPEYSNSVILDQMKKVIDKMDPNMGYDDWLKVGMALHYESGGKPEGLQVWDEWSATSEQKYPGYEFLKEKYLTFGNSPRPTTGAYILHQEVADIGEFEVIKSSEVSDIFEGEKQVNPFMGKFLSRDQWQGLPKPTWLLPKLIPDNGITCIWGPSGSGKSFLAIDLAISVAIGKRWRGHRLKQGTVACIAAEDAFGFRMRVEAVQDANADRGAPVKVLEADPRLQEKKHIEWMVESLKAMGKISLIIVDTLAAATPGMDENSTKEVTQLMAYCRHLQRAIGCAVVLVHHAGKDASRGSRGSSAYKAGFDAEHEVENEALKYSLKVSKVRNAPKTDKQGNRIGFDFALSAIDETCIVDWV
jgi:archaellum biogenesis ATPase FlaH